MACTNCRAEMLDVVLGCSPQRIRHQLDEGIEPRGKAPADLQMNTEDDMIDGRFDKPYPENIANAICQYKIVVPFATAQYRIRDTLGEFFPASIEQRRVWVEGGVVLYIVGFEFGAEAGKTGPSTFPVFLFEIIRAAPATPAVSVSALSASGHASREAAASWNAKKRSPTAPSRPGRRKSANPQPLCGCTDNRPPRLAKDCAHITAKSSTFP